MNPFNTNPRLRIEGTGFLKGGVATRPESGKKSCKQKPMGLIGSNLATGLRKNQFLEKWFLKTRYLSSEANLLKPKRLPP